MSRFCFAGETKTIEFWFYSSLKYKNVKEQYLSPDSIAFYDKKDKHIVKVPTVHARLPIPIHVRCLGIPKRYTLYFLYSISLCNEPVSAFTSSVHISAWRWYCQKVVLSLLRILSPEIWLQVGRSGEPRFKNYESGIKFLSGSYNY